LLGLLLKLRVVLVGGGGQAVQLIQGVVVLALFGLDAGDMVFIVVDVEPTGVRVAAGVEQVGLARA